MMCMRFPQSSLPVLGAITSNSNMFQRQDCVPLSHRSVYEQQDFFFPFSLFFIVPAALYKQLYQLISQKESSLQDSRLSWYFEISRQQYSTSLQLTNCVFGKTASASSMLIQNVYFDGTRRQLRHLQRRNWLVLEYRRGHGQILLLVAVSGMLVFLNSTYINTNTGRRLCITFSYRRPIPTRQARQILQSV